MNSAQLDNKIISIISNLTGVMETKIGLNDTLMGDLKMDSIASIELVSMLAEEFDIDVEMDETLKIERVDQIVELARRHLGVTN